MCGLAARREDLLVGRTQDSEVGFNGDEGESERLVARDFRVIAKEDSRGLCVGGCGA